MSRRRRAESVLEALRDVIPAPETELEYESHWQLLVAVILSAQCTDARVNQVTPALFERFPDAASTAAVESSDVFPLIASISYPNNKSKHLVNAARRIMEVFEGQVPESVDDLQSLAGVGSKTAQVVASEAFNTPTLAVDTHVFRTAHRVGFVTDEADTPQKVERQLKRLLPEDQWSEAHHLLILHGRYTCTARSPQCNACVAAPWCPWKEKLVRLPDPLENLDAKKGKYYCATRRTYFDEADEVTDRTGTPQISCPQCGSMNVFMSKTGQTTKRIKDYRV